MKTEYFVEKNSIVREIWGKSDTILFIFAGAAAEFALNKAVDWLYFTGKLPADPLGRLFSTVTYARKIVFSEENAALQAIDNINKIHSSVEAKRGTQIPDWAYRDVLFMLIDYSIRSFELLEHSLTKAEKQEVLDVFYRVGDRMELKDLPLTYKDFEAMRETHMQEDMHYGHYTKDLFYKYKKNLGSFRYRLLIQTQILLVPKKVRIFLNFPKHSFLSPVIPLYKLSRPFKIDRFFKALILPQQYKEEIRELDIHPVY